MEEELFAAPAATTHNHHARRMLAQIDAAQPFVWSDARNGSHP
ncbi:MAG TPA: hypothetical protein VGO80_12120 [Solirubrobacteraceae bacterium]|nr:hypothetical protein [Solirubrobacteraceae bacterium]